MEYKIKQTHAHIVLKGDFNTSRAKEVATQLSLNPELENISIDLSLSRYVNSEAIFFLYTMLKENKELQLINPPHIFKETVVLLGLGDFFLPLVNCVNQPLIS